MKVRDEEDFNESRRRALAIQKSERARTVKENKLDDLRSDLQARIQQRRQRSDRWVPPEYAQVVNEKAQQAVKAMRLRKEKEREIRKQREMAAAASFLEGRVRQKVSRFSRVVEDIQSAQQQRGTAEISNSWGPKTPRSRERVGRTVVVEAGLPRKGSSSRFMAADRGDVYVLNRQRPDYRTVDGGGDREHPSSQRTVFVEREADLEAYAPNPEPGLSGRSPSTTVYITPDDILNEDW